MSKDIEKTLKDIFRLEKIILGLQEGTNKDLSELKKAIKLINKRLDEIAEKVKEFEIILDEPDEDEIEDDDTDEWTPYDENNYVSEDYDSYREENNDNDETF